MLEDDELNGHNMNLEYADLYLTLLNDTETAWEYANAEYMERPNNIDVNRMLAKIAATENSMDVKKYLVAATRTNSKHPDILQLKNSL